MNRSSEVDAYIARCPPRARVKLRAVRRTIRAAEPKATEVISYGMPGYRFPGAATKGMFAWFGLQSRHIGLYVRPPTIEAYRRQLVEYRTTKSAVHLLLDRDVPAALVRTLVRASARSVRSRTT